MGSRKEDESGPGGRGELMPVTHWSMILQARDQSETALNSLCADYREPLIVWLRCRQYPEHDAKDLVQGFFAHLLTRDFLANVSPDKGRFRTFLLTSFKHYICDQHDKASAGKRGGGQRVESLEETDGQGQHLHEPSTPGAGPDLEYDRAWARTVLANALRRLEAQYDNRGNLALCSALEPVIFADETAFPYRNIGAGLGMSEGAVKVAVHRIRAELRELVRDEVLQTVACEQDWEQEVRYLISLFGR